MNENAKHTAGDWTVSAILRVNFEKPEDCGLYEVEEANEQIVNLLEQGRHDDAHAVAEANRALISAAPRLLAACKAAIRIETLWLPNLPADVSYAGEGEGEIEALLMMHEYFRSAIASATSPLPPSL